MSDLKGSPNIKDSFDQPNCLIDKEGLTLALKHFTSSTLTMRLAGITQINNYINLFNDYCQSDGGGGNGNGNGGNDNGLDFLGKPSDGEELADWILENKIIEHIFGPNLHVEVIKQSHIVLNFVVSQLTKEHIDVIWSSAQLKHCSRQVFDILTPLIKNMNIDAVLHLNSLIRNLEPKDHTEQTLLLSSCLLKIIWTKSLNLCEPATFIRECNPLDDLTMVKSPIFTLLPGSPLDQRHGDQSSSSPSVDNSDEDDEDDFELSMKYKPQPKERVKNNLTSDSQQSCGSQSSSDGGGYENNKNLSPFRTSHRIINTIRIEDDVPFVAEMEEDLQKGTTDSDEDCSTLIGPMPVQRPHLIEPLKKSDAPLVLDINDPRLPMNHISATHLNKIADEDEDEEEDDDEDEDEDEDDDVDGGALPRLVKASLSEQTDGLPMMIMSDSEGDNLLSDSGSNSSQVSQSSQKNMADFDGEDSASYFNIDDFFDPSRKLILQSPAATQLANIACLHSRNFPEKKRTKHQSEGNVTTATPVTLPVPNEDSESNSELSKFTIDNVCKSGQTILWDLLQDDCIGQLSDGLSHDCEKILCSLICWIADKRIRMKFIEGCLDNLSKNYSIIVSLRLLPKLFISFQQYRGGSDTHSITLWADKERQMLKHFFSNLILYAKRREIKPTSNLSGSPHELYTHTEEIQSRLQFLTFIFSYAGSPESFQLSKEQVDTLWNCLATDKECSDELFSWLLNQVRTRDQHALGPEMFKYILTVKIPTLTPDNFSMVTLELLQQLFGFVLTRPQMSESADIAIKKLWDIALLASNSYVSMAAIRNLNSYYVHLPISGLTKEEEFIAQCMDYIKSSSAVLNEDEDKNLTIIQRALILLKTHLEAFRCRFSYHLRLFHLNGDVSVMSHCDNCSSRGNQQVIKIICHPASSNEKTFFDMYSTDFVGELRAEIYHWFQTVVKKCKSGSSEDEKQAFDGPLRLLSQGQELTHDLDEKTLAEMGCKDNQVVYVSIGVSRPSRKLRDTIDPASLLPPPPKNRLPSILLLQPNYFEQLFSLMQLLGSMKSSSSTRAQILSRQVWEIINILPTSPDLLKSFQSITVNDETSDSSNNLSLRVNSLLNPSSPQKLIYSVQIVEWLQRTSKNEENGWAQKFIDCVGLQHLFDIFVSGVLQQGDSDTWNEWKQDCLASLLHLIYQFGIDPLPKDCNKQDATNNSNNHNTINNANITNSISITSNNSITTINSANTSITITAFPTHPSSNLMSNKGFTEFGKRKRNPKATVDKLLVHQFNEKLLEMLRDAESTLKVLLTVLNETTSISAESNYQTRFWGRAQVVHSTLQFLISWAFSDPQIKCSLFQYPNFNSLLKKLVLDDPDPAVRREACTGFYRMCLGSTSSRKTGHIFIPQMLTSAHVNDTIGYIDKEPYGPGCKDYFWLVCRLIDSLDDSNRNEMMEDLNNLCYYMASTIENREINESRYSSAEDEGLRGLLSLMTVTIKQNPPYMFSEEGNKFLIIVFDLLFATPTQKDKNLPKCKSQATRSAAYDLLVELTKGCETNTITLLKLLLNQHKSSSHASYPWDYWPHDGCRSECGYVGLLNLGATCYMASCVQHLFMFPQVRAAILSSKVTNETKHATILQELQKMFAFLSESERKAYNPKSFCKVYTMNSQPLNTGEQKDMTEFFTDLISKLEEMSPQLKETVKSLFAGTLSSNIVTDCGHISRTTEEFYTLRCKVADMRHLWDSLDELTVKDTLEGDNLYNCRCGRKVRAEKRACLKKIPRILSFNTMRYLYNMPTQTKEKVNTYFSFPLRLDLSPYLEENLIPEEGATSKKDNIKNKSNSEKSDKINCDDNCLENGVSDSEVNGVDVKVDEKSADATEDKKQEKVNEDDDDDDESTEYELVGVTVHTGNADGGHYYCFIREPDPLKGKDKWYMFNDAEVKPFDPSQIAAECFGGEMTSKTYDSVNDKFMDFSIEKTNSAYMLFYERLSKSKKSETNESDNADNHCLKAKPAIELNPDIAKWIWEDNIQFLRDKSIFEPTYFNFMWQVCGFIPSTLQDPKRVALLNAQLATSFVLETFIHSKEKPSIANWIELLTKQFNTSQQTCEWLLETLAEDYHNWPVQILIKCPNQMVRQLFQQLIIHVISQIRSSQEELYKKGLQEDVANGDMKESSFSSSSSPSPSPTQFPAPYSSTTSSPPPPSISQQQTQPPSSSNTSIPSSPTPSTSSSPLSSTSTSKGHCVARFIRRLVSLAECNNSLVRPHLRHLTEYFTLLFEFSKLGEEETNFLLRINTISIVVQFYLSHYKGAGECIEILSDEDEEDEEETVQSLFLHGFRAHAAMPPINLPEKYPRPASLDKMITFVSSLIEKSRSSSNSNQLGLSSSDLESVLGGKSFPFIQRQIRDNINLRQSFNLICSLSRYNEATAQGIVNMLLHSISRQPETSQPFFRILSMLVELSPEQSGLPSFSNLIYPRIWEIAEQNPHHCLEWLTAQVPRNKAAHSLVLFNLNNWVEYFLLAHNNQRVRNAAALLIISLVPNNLFRQSYFKSPRTLMLTTRESMELTNEAIQIIRQVFTCLLQHLKNAKNYLDPQNHGTAKLTSYFAVMAYCLVSRQEKLMLVPYFSDLWNLFQPKLSEPAIAINQNKQSLLYFWHQACIDCPENIKCIIQNSHVTKNIAFNYILADHEDQEVVLFNRMMLPSYYGLLYLCCIQCRSFTRHLALHQNIQWAFKNITPYYTQYQSAVTELFKLMKLFVTVHPDCSDAELRDILQFKRNTLQMYLTSMDSRSCWTTLITAFTILIENEEDQIFAILNGGIIAFIQSFNTLFMMFHEATACHITNEIVDLLKLLTSLLITLRNSQQPEVREWSAKWKDHLELIRKLILLLNTFTPSEVRSSCMAVLLEIVQIHPKDCIPLVVQTLGLGHLTFQDQLLNFSAGPFFPRRGQRATLSKSSLRPSRPVFQMHFHPKMLEVNLGADEDYDKAIIEYYLPYYKFICDLCRIAVSQNIVNPELVGLCSMVASESLLMQIILFPELWLSYSKSCDDGEQEFFNLLCTSSNYFRDYICMILTGDRNFLNEDTVFELVKACLSKVYGLIINQHFVLKMLNIVNSLRERLDHTDLLKDAKSLIGDIRAIILIMGCDPPSNISNELKAPMLKFREKCLSLKDVSEEVLFEHETPHKKRKTREDLSMDESSKDVLSENDENMKDRLEKTIMELQKVLDSS
uniref:USP domain-containing protein n=1 Tax=Tetranychus urticae TaxID=32264 RepID=T1K3V7_TETUR